MKLVALLLLGAVALAGATRVAVQDRELVDALANIKGTNRAFEAEIRAILEALREVMLAGAPDFNVPVLDPFELDEQSFDFQIPNTADIKLLIRKLNVRGLAGFVVNKVDFNILRRRFDFDISIPSIKGAVGFYDLLAKIINYNFFGKGDGNVEVVNLRFHGSAFLTIRSDLTLNMSKFDIKVELEAFKSQVNGLLGGGEVSDVINEIIQELVPGLVETQADLISSAIEEFVVPFANQFLNEITLQDLIDIIGGGGGGR